MSIDGSLLSMVYMYIQEKSTIKLFAALLLKDFDESVYLYFLITFGYFPNYYIDMFTLKMGPNRLLIPLKLSNEHYLAILALENTENKFRSKLAENWERPDG